MLVTIDLPQVTSWKVPLDVSEIAFASQSYRDDFLDRNSTYYNKVFWPLMISRISKINEYNFQGLTMNQIKKTTGYITNYSLIINVVNFYTMNKGLSRIQSKQLVFIILHT